MTVKQQVKDYISGQPEGKCKDLQYLHEMISGESPGTRLWFLDGKDSSGKIVSNPNIGYGQQYLKYADGRTKEFYQVGLSANTTGISVYIMGIADKKYLANKFGNKLGKATVTGYCIKFKSLKDINIDILREAIQFGLNIEQG